MQVPQPTQAYAPQDKQGQPASPLEEQPTQNNLLMAAALMHSEGKLKRRSKPSG